MCVCVFATLNFLSELKTQIRETAVSRRVTEAQTLKLFICSCVAPCLFMHVMLLAVFIIFRWPGPDLNPDASKTGEYINGRNAAV